MGKNIVTKDTFVSKVTEITKDYLDKGWTFNLEYMRCSNGTYFTAVTDGTETHLIYFKEKYNFFTDYVILRVEKFNTVSDNIFVEEGEILHEEVFVQKWSKVNPDEREYYKVNSLKDLEESRKKHEKRFKEKNTWDHKKMGDEFRVYFANRVKKLGNVGFTRFSLDKVSDVNYDPRTNRYYFWIKDTKIEYSRNTHSFSGFTR